MSLCPLCCPPSLAVKKEQRTAVEHVSAAVPLDWTLLCCPGQGIETFCASVNPTVSEGQDDILHRAILRISKLIPSHSQNALTIVLNGPVTPAVYKSKATFTALV